MIIQKLAASQCGFRALMSLQLKKQIMNFTSSAVRYSEQHDDKEVIIESLSGGKGSFTLNRPKQLNTLNLCMVCQIRPTLISWSQDKYLILMKGAGEKAFCAGGDVVSVVKDKTGETGKKFFREEYKMDALISCLKIPYVAIINGITMGGGVGISIFGKYRIATETSLFAMPETQIGFFPDVGVSYVLARMPNQLGPFLGLTGYRLKGYDLIHAGVATHFCSTKNLCELEKALLCDFSRDCCSCPEEIIKEFQEKSLKDIGQSPPKFSLEPHLKTIETWFCDDTFESVYSKISKDSSKFGTDTKELLSSMSPLSLKVTYKQIKDAANLDKFDCFNVDYRIACRMLECGDFAEGVRALLIDKDKKPKWKHSDVSKVTDEEVSNFFNPLPEEEELRLPDTIYDP
ncbi:conserved hypothetical protein [Pediculus humanus corporis]|uniref:3-hydroxyisobutyryl-CoA hydrolase, mitochondrial n=1 Tax=Pediculus humanus subsp. corporis TaxID=121224 RepID=E0VLB5_PEDHC|nr:uncharacterized protein Phum_PHUM285470 [Pediculus humanus corporis]EEB14171.1 conserved hypothetical protein [Pediculus humanus corporis]